MRIRELMQMPAPEMRGPAANPGPRANPALDRRDVERGLERLWTVLGR